MVEVDTCIDGSTSGVILLATLSYFGSVSRLFVVCQPNCFHFISIRIFPDVPGMYVGLFGIYIVSCKTESAAFHLYPYNKGSSTREKTEQSLESSGPL